MITCQSNDFESEQQSKRFEQYLIIQNEIKKESQAELLESFLKKLHDAYEKSGDLMEILCQSKSQTIFD